MDAICCEHVVGHNFEGWLLNSILTVLSMTNFFSRASDRINVKMLQIGGHLELDAILRKFGKGLDNLIFLFFFGSPFDQWVEDCLSMLTYLDSLWYPF